MKFLFVKIATLPRSNLCICMSNRSVSSPDLALIMFQKVFVSSGYSCVVVFELYL